MLRKHFILNSVGFAEPTDEIIRWSTGRHTIEDMTPLWLFPGYPLLIAGPFAAALVATEIDKQDDRALQIIVGGVMAQSIGYSISFSLYAIYLYRLMSNQVPPTAKRPAMFISVGPSGFTAQSIILMGQSLRHVVSPGFMGSGALTGQITHVLANWIGIWIWA